MSHCHSATQIAYENDKKIRPKRKTNNKSVYHHLM